MRVCLCFPYFDPQVRKPAEMLERYPLLARLPGALADRGHQILVLQLSPSHAELAHKGAHYHFQSPGRVMLRLGEILQRLRPHEGSAYYQLAWRQAREIMRWRPEIVHIFGLTLDPQLALLVRAGERSGAKIVVHYHGGFPPRSVLASWFAKQHLQRIDRVLMTTPQQAIPWIEAGMLSQSQIRLVMESSVAIAPCDKVVARQQTRMRGDPIFLATGRLDPIKDPLTLMRGFAGAVPHFSDPRLYLYYRDAPMLDAVRRLVASDVRIRDRVEFRGEATVAEMGAIYSSADVFLQASLREWSGLALMEALACGCVPVVSNIPSFERLTNGARIGRLFDVGDAAGMARQIVSLDAVELLRMSQEAQRWFTESLSFEALARDLERVYAEITPELNRAAGTTTP